MTVNVIFTVLFTLCPDPLTVMVCVLKACVLPTLIVSVEVPAPGAAIGFGLNEADSLAVKPVADKVIAESNEPEGAVVIVIVPDDPLAMLIDDGEAEMAILAATLVTFSFTVVVDVRLPLVPVTVNVYVPATVAGPTVTVIVLDPAPVIAAGLNPIVTPVGWPLVESVMEPAKPPETALLIVAVPEFPCPMLSEVEEDDSVKLGCGGPPRAAINAPPLGLPQPVTKSYPTVAGNPLFPDVTS